MSASAEAGLKWLEGLVEELPVIPLHAALFRLQIEEGREQAARHPLPAAELPGLVHAAACGEPAPPPLAGACLCVWLGADLLDNVVDEELAGGWRQAGPKAATVVAASFVPLIWKALGRLPAHGVSRERVAELGELFADRLLALSSGEQADLLGPEDRSPDAAIRIAEGKSGTQFALYAAAGALTAGAPTEAYADYGAALGTASQLMSDLSDVCCPPSDDLRSGALTLPILHALAGPARERVEQALEAARASDEAHEDARRALIEAGAPAHVAQMAGGQRERAYAALERAGAREPAAGELRELVDVGSEVALVARAGGDSAAIADALAAQAGARAGSPAT